MALRRVAVVAMVVLSACSFSRGSDEADDTDTTAFAIPAMDDTSTSFEDTTTVAETTTTARATATTVRAQTRATTAATAARAPAPTRPPTTVGPHCNAYAADTYTNSTWTVNVTSTFPNTEVTMNVQYAGGSGSYTGTTDGNGSWTKTQQTRPANAWRGRVTVNVYVGGKSCSTSFMVN